MERLPDREYTCVVVGDSNDTEHRGAVRVKILGLTNSLTDKEQVHVYPALMNGIQQVPQIGYYLRVRFENGDPHCGRYFGMSATPSVIPAAFYAEYPDVAVGNCGEDGFFYEHNRKTHITTITNPGNYSKMIWDNNGYVTYESSIAHTNAGMGAKDGSGKNVLHVLTEGTVDIFTCMPVGHNRENTGIGQGSEYLSVSHISQATIDAFHGQAEVTPASPSTAVPQVEQDLEKIELVDKNGEYVTSGTTFVRMDRTDQVIKRVGKQATHILVCHTEGECFPVMANKIMDPNSNCSAHFLVGKADGEPEVLGDNADKSHLRNYGFYQFIDLSDDGYAYSGSNISGRKANVDAVIIMVVGSATEDLSSYQHEIVSKLIWHIRSKTGISDLPVMTPGDFDFPMPTALINFETGEY